MASEIEKVIDRLRETVSLVDTASSYGVDLQKDGDEFVACCPFHVERTPSFTIFQGRSDGVWRFHCFGCDKHGDIVDFVESIKGVSTREALEILGGRVAAGHNVAPVSVPVRDIYAGIEPLAQQPAGLAVGRNIVLYNPKRERSMNFVPSMVHPYTGAGGELVGYVLRRDYQEDGKARKETPMVRRVRLPTGEECWSRFPFPEPRPLYNLAKIGDDRQVFVVEGEKCADAIFRLRGRAAVSWVGGTHGVAHTDWTPLRGRDVVIWPDADGPGWETANAIAEALAGVAARVRFIDVLREATASERDDF